MSIVTALALIVASQTSSMSVEQIVPAPASTSKPDKKAKRVCKSFQNTSSRLVKDRICKTQAEWDADRVKSAIDFDKMRIEGMRVEQTGGPDF